MEGEEVKGEGAGEGEGKGADATYCTISSKRNSTALDDVKQVQQYLQLVYVFFHTKPSRRCCFSSNY